MAKAAGKRTTKQSKPSFSAEALHYLAILATRGTHGSSVNDVIRTMVGEGIRQAFRDGVLRPADLRNAPRDEGEAS
jgi:hypothetical protein